VSFRPSDDFAAVGSVLERNGYDGIDVRTGFSSMPAPVKVLPPGYALPLAARLRPHVKVPLLAGGRITTPLEAAAAIRDAGLAAVVLGRALLRDPDWPRKALSGHAVDACPYTCDPSCYSEFKAGARLHCLRAGTNG
jgi:2,4-dienoyl-CoA reductase-like NADH-dependent reductase (Old Yellow Enzyme family)